MKNAITDYNAVGDGVTVDSTVLKNAAASGYPVLLPYTPNGYVVDDTLIMASGTHFIGEPGTKIIHKGTKPLFSIGNSYCKIKQFKIDGSNTSSAAAVVIQLITSSQDLQDIYIEDIYLNNSYGLITDQASNYVLENININNIISRAPKGSTIYLNNSVSNCEVGKILIDYTRSSIPNNKAIHIAKTNGIIGGITLDKIKILGSNSQSCTSQDGIYVGPGEHLTLSNINIIFMGGTGLTLNSSINFRLSNINTSFCTGNQCLMTSCTDSTISNVMTRGRANGSLSFLVLSTYGLVLSSCLRMVFSSCNFKSCGAGVWLDNSSLITMGACQYNINQYYGIISTGSNVTSNIVGGSFSSNGLKHILHSSRSQASQNCSFDGRVGNFTGQGTI